MLKSLVKGISLFLFISGVIVLGIALLLNIKDFDIEWEVIFAREQATEYIIYGVISIIVLATSFGFLARTTSSSLVWISLICIGLALFFSFWYPFYREEVSNLILWLTPSIATIGFTLLWFLIAYRKSKFHRVEKEFNSLIINSSHEFNSYERINAAKLDDKSAINLVDGVERKDSMNFYDIDFSILEHDK